MVGKAWNARSGDDSRGYEQCYKHIAHVTKECSLGNQTKPVSG